MNARHWIDRFAANRSEEQIDWESPLVMPESVRRSLAKSLAVFQLGETGTGGTLRRCAEKVRGDRAFEGYEQALQAFINEEHRHAGLLARMVRRLGGDLLERQWSNSTFRRVRKLINLEFQLQMFLTAELVAEVYYEVLRRRVPDGPLRQACARIVKDEVGHTAFHAAFFGALQRNWPSLGRLLWKEQFRLVHRMASAVVWWDHRACFRALGVKRAEFHRLSVRAWRAWVRRMEAGGDRRMAGTSSPNEGSPPRPRPTSAAGMNKSL